MSIQPPVHGDFLNVRFQAHNAPDGASRIYAFFDGKLMTRPGTTELPVYEELAGVSHEEPLYIGELDGQPQFATELEEPIPGYEMDLLWNFLGTFESSLFNFAGRAYQLLNWDRTHRYCGVCGSITEQSLEEWSRICVSCAQSFYPRISPCAIMSIRRGEHILLAQSPNHRHDMFTILAGFIEPGESVEQAVAREVYEEVGVSICNVRYFGSQPWPFPGQLMLGFLADYNAGELAPDTQEVVNSAWFHYRNLPPHPPETTISGRLIRHTQLEIAQDVEAK